MGYKRDRSDFPLRYTRGKPIVAGRNEHVATANIHTKLSILESWLSSEIPFARNNSGEILLDSRERKQLEYFPSTMRQFNNWDGSQNCEWLRSSLPKIHANANETLRKRPDLRNSITQVISHLVKMATTHRKERSESIVALKQKLKVEVICRERLEDELLEHHRQLKLLEKENKRLIAINRSGSEEWQKTISQMEITIETYRNEVLSLKEKLVKVTPIRKAS